jgi:predicted phosphodiesterase
MILAVISDIHANLEALEAVMRDIEKQKVDAIYCLGDVIGYGSDPIPCLDLVQSSCAVRLMGNHEFAVLGKLPMYQLNDTAKVSISWTQSQVPDRVIPRISDNPFETTIDDLQFVHASPYEPEKWHYVLSTADSELAFRHGHKRLCFNGHSHVPMIFATGEGVIRKQAGHDFQPFEDTRYLINVGSVGQPRDNDPRACYVVYDSAEEEVRFCRVEYDIAGAQRKMKQAQLPTLLINRLETGV